MDTTKIKGVARYKNRAGVLIKQDYPSSIVLWDGGKRNSIVSNDFFEVEVS